MAERVSIHAPWEGCDSPSYSSPTGRTSFNSRTLGGVRLPAVSTSEFLIKFQFTHPGRGATGYPRPTVERLKFQFTHPSRGATDKERILNRLQRVSIHAPWEGCDGWRPRSWNSGWKFQFTHPGRGATLVFPDVHTANCTFQFTHPGRGATVVRPTKLVISMVSIHAPWEGCDESSLSFGAWLRSFNSRTLGGVRH